MGQGGGGKLGPVVLLDGPFILNIMVVIQFSSQHCRHLQAKAVAPQKCFIGLTKKRSSKVQHPPTIIISNSLS